MCKKQLRLLLFQEKSWIYQLTWTRWISKLKKRRRKLRSSQSLVGTIQQPVRNSQFKLFRELRSWRGEQWVDSKLSQSTLKRGQKSKNNTLLMVKGRKRKLSVNVRKELRSTVMTWQNKLPWIKKVKNQSCRCCKLVLSLQRSMTLPSPTLVKLIWWGLKTVLLTSRSGMKSCLSRLKRMLRKRNL